MQCRKHLGTCICHSCARKAEESAASERRRWYYEEVLSAYAKQLSADPKKYEDELRDAERFVAALQADIAVRPKASPLHRVRATWERNRH